MKLLTAAIVLTTMLTIVSSASAQRVHVPFRGQAAVTEQYAYWVKTRVAGCKDCRELRRTRLADGAQESVLTIRRGYFANLTAGFDTVAFTINYRGDTLRTRVRAIRDDGFGATLARASYRVRSKRDCGSTVTAGAVSQAGEVAWVKTNVTSDYDCNQSFSKITGGVFARTVVSTQRQIGRTIRQSIGDPQFFVGFPIVRRIRAFNGTRYLWVGSFKLNVFDSLTGRDVEVTSTDVDYASHSVSMGPGGAVAADYWGPDDNGLRTRLILDPTQPGGIIELASADGVQEGVRFCGANLIQVRSDTGRFIVIRRDSAGVEVGRTILSVPNWAGSFEFDCNSSTGLVRYFKWRDAGQIRGETALAFPLPAASGSAGN